jgi:hypothetical protein
MSRRTRSGPIRIIALVRAGWAGVLLLAPRRILRVAGCQQVPAASVTVARVLGARHLVQAVVSAAAPSGGVAGLGAVVDTLHAASCAGLAAMSPRWRRPVLLDAVIESGFAVAGGQSSQPPR